MSPYNVVTVNGVLLRLGVSEGKVWVRQADLVKALKCSYRKVHFHAEKLSGEHKTKDGGKFLSELAVLQVCGSIKTTGVPEVIKWLDAGGMRLSSTGNRPAPKSTPKPAKTAPHRNTVAYCHALVCELLQHASIGDMNRFTQLVENEVAGILARHPSEELNYARYDLFRRFYLQGGEK
ncbi:hypothetical protein ACRT4E_000787 [Pseudomonas aeruginosa]|nr:hypothetical protein [Pseudomonas aeruginosa]